MKYRLSLGMVLLSGVLSAVHPGCVRQVQAQTFDVSGARQQIRALLSLPFATDLVGARNADRFAWVEKRNGVRNVLVADAAGMPRTLTHFTQDDGTDIWGLALSPNGKTLAYVAGGDPEYPDDPSPNPDLSAFG